MVRLLGEGVQNHRLNKFSKINCNYPAIPKAAAIIQFQSKSTMKLINFLISRRDLVLWKTVLDTTLKEIESLFKANH